MKKRSLYITLLLLITASASACPVCERNQPKMLRGVVHGVGPDSNWDYLIIGVVSVIVVFTAFYSFKWLIKPGEQRANHIKRTVLNN